MYVNKPHFQPLTGKYVVVIKQSKHPLSKVIERMEFESYDTAYQAYRYAMKELGYGL